MNVHAYILGWYDLLEKLAKVKRCQKTACRALHRLIRTTGICLPLEVDVAKVTIKKLKPLGVHEACWPFLTMQTWVKYLLEHKPQFLLGGHHLRNFDLWGPMLHTFWTRYRSCDPKHWIYNTTTPGIQFCETVPYCFHGDEGRGSGRVPFMVLSFQPVISLLGVEVCNDSSYLC